MWGLRQCEKRLTVLAGCATLLESYRWDMGVAAVLILLGGDRLRRRPFLFQFALNRSKYCLVGRHVPLWNSTGISSVLVSCSISQ